MKILINDFLKPLKAFNELSFNCVREKRPYEYN